MFAYLATNPPHTISTAARPTVGASGGGRVAAAAVSTTTTTTGGVWCIGDGDGGGGDGGDEGRWEAAAVVGDSR